MRKTKDWLSAYMKYSHLLESPDSFHLWSAISTVAACVGRQIWIDFGYFKIYPNLYVVLVSPSGKCYSGDTDVLTEDGWKNIKDVKVGDNVLGMDLETQTSFFVPVLDTQTVYSENMVSIKGKEKIDLLVTPDHNMVVGKPRKSGRPLLTLSSAHALKATPDWTIPINEDEDVKISNLQVNKVEFNDLAYCVTVPTGTVYVRRNGRACWSGNCRKNIAMKTATDLLQHFPDVKISAEAITREALIRSLKQSEAVVEMPDGKIYVHSSLAIVSEELSVFLGHSNYALMALLTDLFDCADSWEYKTKTQGVDFISGCCLNILAGSTPTWLCGSIPLSAIGGGLTSRIVFVVEEDVRRKTAFLEIGPAELEIKDALIHDLASIRNLRGPVTVSSGARKFYEDWYVGNSSALANDRVSGYYERKHIHLLKTSTIVSVCQTDSLIIERDHIEIALALLDRIEPKMVDAFGAVGRSVLTPDIDLLYKTILALGRATKNQILESVWRDIDPRFFDVVVGTLSQMGRVSIERDTETGRIYYTAVSQKEEEAWIGKGK